MEDKDTTSSDESSATSFTTVEPLSPTKDELILGTEMEFLELYSENVIAKLWRVATANEQTVEPLFHVLP
jgi:hypothetical protein